MKEFQFYVTDDRYGVRSFMLVQTDDEAAARTLAERMLANKHYHAIEVWNGECKLLSLSDSDPSQA